jgi:hypothetical protein
LYHLQGQNPEWHTICPANQDLDGFHSTVVLPQIIPTQEDPTWHRETKKSLPFLSVSETIEFPIVNQVDLERFSLMAER